MLCHLRGKSSRARRCALRVRGLGQDVHLKGQTSSGLEHSEFSSLTEQPQEREPTPSAAVDPPGARQQQTKVLLATAGTPAKDPVISVAVGELCLAGASRQVLFQDLALSVALGQAVCILGPSGCGKSTMWRAMAGL